MIKFIITVSEETPVNVFTISNDRNNIKSVMEIHIEDMDGIEIKDVIEKLTHDYMCEFYKKRVEYI